MSSPPDAAPYAHIVRTASRGELIGGTLGVQITYFGLLDNPVYSRKQRFNRSYAVALFNLDRCVILAGLDRIE